VCTVGQVSVWPGASNVIAGAVNLTVDIRSRRDALRTGATEHPDALHSGRALRARALTRMQRLWRTCQPQLQPCAASAAWAVLSSVRCSTTQPPVEALQRLH
jgi:hypothetical protein